MGDFIALERMVWFDSHIKSGQFPNATKLANHFEISTRTARRCIDFMRDRLCAPIEYNPSAKGYYYRDDAFELPHFQVSQEELLSILLARSLLSKTVGGQISRSIGKFSKKLFAEIKRMGFSEAKIERHFSAIYPGHSPTHPATFTKTVKAMLNSTLLSFTYESPGSNQITQRIAEPHHLQYYMASWVLTARCRLRGQWRKFFLARMANVKITNETFTLRPESEWQNLVDKTFGIFQGEIVRWVVLHFSPFRSRWIKNEIWHSKQQIEVLKDGSLKMRLPVTDFREIKMKILQYGADVSVIAPDELKEEIAQEIKKMAVLYKI